MAFRPSLLLTKLGDRSGTVSNKRATIKVPSTVTDITGEEDKYTLDGCGFQLCHHEAKSPCQKDGYRDEEKLKEEYFPEMEQLLKDMYASQH